MQNQYSIPVVHPAFELLKRSARILHFIAASLILVNAVREFRINDMNRVLCYTQMVISADIFLLVFLGGSVLSEAPKLNLVFRFIEFMVLIGISLMLISDGYGFYGFLHMVISTGYIFLFYREWRVLHSEAVDIRPTGITLPNFIRDSEISWNDIRSIVPRYHSIMIETFRNRRIQFQLRRNLKIEELQQIDEFCQKHLVNG